MIAEQKAKTEGQYARQLSTNFLDTAESQAAITAAGEQQKELLDQISTNAVSAGASTEAQIAAKTGLNKGMTDLYGGLAAKGTARRDSIIKDKMASEDKFFGLELGQAKERTQSAVNFASNMANVGAAGLYADSMGAFDGSAWDGMKPSGGGGLNHFEIQSAIGKKWEPIKFGGNN